MTSYEKIMTFIDLNISDLYKERNGIGKAHITHVEMTKRFLCDLLHECPTCLTPTENGFKFQGCDVHIRNGKETMPFNIVISSKENNFDIRKF